MLRRPPQLPPLFTATAASILEDAEALVKRTREVYDQLTATISPDTATFSNAIQPLARAENARIQGYRILTFYSSVSPDAEVREASRKARVLLEAFVAETEMRDDLFALIDAVASNLETAHAEDVVLNLESQSLVTRLRQDFAISGLELRPGPARDRFRDIKNRIEELAGEIKKNIAEADAEIWLTPQELEGVPESELSKLVKGEGANEGKLRLRANSDDLGSVLRNSWRGDTRMHVKNCRANRCDQNMPLLKEVFFLRDEAARLLGRSNHAALRMEEKIAKTPEKVNDFLSSLQGRFSVAGRQHIEKLKEVKRRDVESRGGSFDGYFFSWDEPYCERLLEDDRSESEGRPKISEFFPLESTVVAMLGMFERLFGLRFIEILGANRDELSPSGDGSDMVWSEDVQVYAVWDSEAEDDNGFLGYLYLDLYSRDGKSKGVFNSNVVPGFIHEDGTLQFPSTAMVCNYPVHTSEKPSLLGHWPVVLLFHELGHAIHDLVSKTRYARFHGPAGTHVDYGEFPSQMLENWCWIPEQLKELSRHYSYLSPVYLETWRAENEGRPQPPERLTDELIESIVRPDQPNHSALHYLQQLRLCIFDMAVHQPQSHDEIARVDISEMWNKLQTSVCLFDDEVVPDCAGRSDSWTSFGHLVNDYEVGYYSYLFSNVFSADVFRSVFRASPMDTQKGKEYRQAVLEKGGSQDGIEILRAFLGREPMLAPFYEETGLAES